MQDSLACNSHERELARPNERNNGCMRQRAATRITPSFFWRLLTCCRRCRCGCKCYHGRYLEQYLYATAGRSASLGAMMGRMQIRTMHMHEYVPGGHSCDDLPLHLFLCWHFSL